MKHLRAATALGFLVLGSGSQSGRFPLITPTSVDGKPGFLDVDGRAVVDATFLVCRAGKTEAAALMVEGKRAYVDLKGRFRFVSDDPPAASAVVAISRISEGTPSERKEQWGFADSSGRVILEPQFDEFQGFSEGIGRVVKNRLWGFVDADGRVLVEPRFKSAYWFSEGLSAVLLDDSKWAYADRRGTVVSDPRYEYFSFSFSEGVVPAKRSGKWGYVDKTFKFVIEPQFDHASSFSEGLAWVWTGGKAHSIDHDGRVVIEPRTWDMVAGFSEGLALVRPPGGELFGYIDRSGRLVIPYLFSEAGSFRGGLARVSESSDARMVSGCWQGYSYINRLGEYIWKGKPRL
jgi:hypothetical protein